MANSSENGTGGDAAALRSEKIYSSIYQVQLGRPDLISEYQEVSSIQDRSM
jgi:hypothetical protein